MYFESANDKAFQEIREYKLSYLQPSMVVAGFLFTAGAIVMAVSPNLGCMFAGRVILGFGVGAGTMVSRLLSAAFILSRAA